MLNAGLDGTYFIFSHEGEKKTLLDFWTKHLAAFPFRAQGQDIASPIPDPAFFFLRSVLTDLGYQPYC